jgi:hypothetical protein
MPEVLRWRILAGLRWLAGSQRPAPTPPDGPGWRFTAEHSPRTLHTALLVREAGGLPVRPGAEIPPRLSEQVRRRIVLPAGDRVLAGGDWPAWWRRLAAFHARESRLRELPRGRAEQLSWARSQRDRQARVFDPPDFVSLAQAPELRTAARLVWAQCPAGPAQQRHGDAPAPEFGPRLVSDIAVGVAAEHGVPASSLDAGVLILDVEGLWSWHAGPGFAFCSAAVPADATAAEALLREVFASSLS